jgi:hypothetical protein
VPESRGRKKDVYTPPPAKKDPVKLGPSRWVGPAMVAMFVIGLVWIVVFYIAGTSVPVMKDISALWNVLIGFGFIGAGFVLATRWR